MVVLTAGDLVKSIQPVTSAGEFRVQIDPGYEGEVHSVGLHDAFIEFQSNQFPCHPSWRTVRLWIQKTDFDKFVVQTRCGQKSESHEDPLEMHRRFVKKRVSRQLGLEMYLNM